MNESPLVSIIIPIYNVEKYISSCLDTIIKQTYKNIEILLIDDGSTDNSSKVCDEYAKKDNRIIVAHKTNVGVSKTRNTGLEMAHGEYIYFVDSDDYISLNTIERLIETLKESGCDCAYLNAVEVDDDGNIFNKHQNYYSGAVVDGNKVVEDILTDKIGSHLWRFITKREFYEGISFPQGQVFEDVYVIFRIIEKCKKIAFLGEDLYYYRKNDKGIVNGKNSIRKQHDYVLAIAERYYYSINRKLPCKKYCFGKLVDNISIFFSFVSRLSIKDDEKKYVLEIEKILDNIKWFYILRSNAKPKYKLLAMARKIEVDKLFYKKHKRTINNG